MYAHVDADGHHHTILEAIVDYKKDGHATPMADKYIYTKSGQKRIRQSTAGWKLLILWKDGSEQWIPLSIMKESNPIEVAAFATSQGIAEEPYFVWWIPFTLRKRDRIGSAVNARVKKISHNYGV